MIVDGGIGAPPGVEPGHRREVVALRARGVHQRDEHRDRADREGRLVLPDRVEHHLGLEAVGEHERDRDEQGDREVPDDARDVEQRGDAEHGVLGAQLDPVPVGAGVEHHVAVGVHRALRRAGRPRRVAEEGDVVEAELHRLGLAVADGGEHLGEVLGALVAHAFDRPEQAGVVARLVLQRRGRPRDAQRRDRRDDLGGDLAEEVLLGEQRGGLAVAEQRRQLARSGSSG